MKIKKHITILFIAIASSMASAQVKFEVKATKHKLGIDEYFEVIFRMDVKSDSFTPPSFDDFIVMNKWEKAIQKDTVLSNQDKEKIVFYKLVPKKVGKFSIGEGKLTIDRNLYKTKSFTIEVVNESFYNPKSEESVETRFDEGIYIMAEASRTKLKIKDSLLITYTLYVSSEIGVKKLKINNKPSYPGFNILTFQREKLKTKNKIYKKNKEYKVVVLNKVILRPSKLGTFIIPPLVYYIMVEVPVLKKEISSSREYLTRKEVNKTVNSNTLKVSVIE